MNSQGNVRRMALITGSTGLLGRAICERLAKDGVELCLSYLSSNSVAEEQAHTLSQQFGTRCVATRLDVTRADSVQTAVDELVRNYGGVDILVTAHGVAPQQVLRFARNEDIEQAFAVNAAGNVYCVRAVLPAMQRRRWGRMVLLGSAAVEGRVGQSVYAASKAAQLGLVRCTAREYAKYGITINVVAPAIVEGGPATRGNQREKLLERFPMGSFVPPEDVASAVAFLASDEARSITGQQLVIDGGRS